ncbi:hypothetical protein KKC22_15300 [Myxococcota bacterium]|nr:hypothetical protein [Myxococcota bacterium]
MRSIIIVLIAITAVACNDGNTTQPTNNVNNNTEICNDNIDNDFDGDIDCDDFDCEFTTACQVGNCGNGIVEGSEECDGADFDGKSCITEGYTAGQLSCTAGCVIDIEGCENPDPLKIMQSGARIKMRVGRSSVPDGSVSFNGWYDTTLAINCAWRRHTDGSMRCLPELTGKRLYTDNACTNPALVGVSSEDAALGQTALLSVYGGDGKYIAVRVVYAYTDNAYVMNAPGMCQSGGHSNVGIYMVQDHPASAFQEQLETLE